VVLLANASPKQKRKRRRLSMFAFAGEEMPTWNDWRIRPSIPKLVVDSNS
jgi:hypothetical protein